jgi:acyl-coenzyme A synthetase/AMP-(fatty) acid ligase
MLRSRCPHVEIFSNYGMTECKRIAFLHPDQLDIRPMSVGKALPGTDAFLIDGAGHRIVEPGVVGELAVTSPLVMQGYWDQPELTERVLSRREPGESATLLTGDLFETDAEGYLYFVCRKGDLSDLDGHTVNPRAVERQLLAHPLVLEAAVVPVRQGSAVALHAHVVPVPAGGLTAEALALFCQTLPASSLPAAFHFVDGLPRTFGGKTSRRDIESTRKRL